LTRTERYATAYPYQTVVDIQVYQGEDEDALRNVLVGDFRIDEKDRNRDRCGQRHPVAGSLAGT
jgi:molecular chaperone DnaK (HSP70)